MAKNVFRANEVINSADQVTIEAPILPSDELEELSDEPEEYTGPTADDLRREAEMFKQQWEQEKEGMIAQARSEAEKIVKEAEQKAFDEVELKTNEAKKIEQEAKDEVDRITAEAEKKAESLTAESEARLEQIEKNAYDKGFAEGEEAGYEEGQNDVKRLVDQLHKIIATAVERRNEIIDQTETQVIGLVLQISQKVIKVISENQKNVVVNNVIQALRKLKTRNDVIIRVNLEDVEIASERIKDFMRMVENVKSITVVEDTTVDRGGCIIETDFGEIDARISSQLNEIQQKVLEMAPIQIKQD